MRNPVASRSVALLAGIAFCGMVMTQIFVARPAAAQANGTGAAKPPAAGALNLVGQFGAKPFLNPLVAKLAQNREIPKVPGPVGPAPKRDLTGAWVGPTKMMMGEIPPMTPAGEARFKQNKPEREYTLAASNDPFGNCDPLGLPRNIMNHPVINGGQWFGNMPNRIVIMYQYQRVWRDIWMDGRELPKAVDTRGAPDSRYYGYSVGHWEGDNTLVVDTTGVDDRTWLDDLGHPHSNSMHMQERYTRLDQYNIEFTITIDDPKFYTKPFQFLKANYYWMVKQDFEETFCLPSEAVAYMNSLAKPAGTGDGGK